MTLITNGKISVGCPPPSSSLGLSGEEWTSFLFRINDFKSLEATNGHYIETPVFNCNGHEWKLRVHPGGDDIDAGEGYVSVFLHHLPREKCKVTYTISIIDKFGDVHVSRRSNEKLFTSNNRGWGWNKIISRSDILAESENILASDGCLNIVVSIQEDPTTVFVPKHPLLEMIKDMFNDEATADVCFEVNECIGEKNENNENTEPSVLFHAHRSILKKCAPILADLMDDNDTAIITDMDPDIFQHLLYHIYGGEVSREELETSAKDIIDAADKYAIINLKLMAEAAYVESTDITFDNAIDNLLYADSKNCALLKEKTLAFLAENHYEAAEKISFTEFPGHVVKDLLVAFGRKDKDDSSAANVDELTTLCVSALRRKVYDLGLEVDGSREAMIEAIKNDNSSDD